MSQSLTRMSRRRSRATWQRNQRDREEPGCSHRSLRNQKVCTNGSSRTPCHTWGDLENKNRSSLLPPKLMCFSIKHPFGRRKALAIKSNLRSNFVSVTSCVTQETFISVSTKLLIPGISTTPAGSPVAMMLLLSLLAHK